MKEEENPISHMINDNSTLDKLKRAVAWYLKKEKDLPRETPTETRSPG